MRLRYAKSLDEGRELQKLYAEPAFERRRATYAVCETDAEVISAVLPSPLQPTDSPRVTVGVLHCGASNALQSFGGGGLAVEAQYEGIRGAYPLTMPMSTDSAVIFGRELYAEPKKLAEIEVRRDGDPIVGTVRRHGITYIEIRDTGRSRLVERLDGELILRESPHDPVVDIPVRNLLRVTYTEGDTYTHGEVLARVPAESFLRYVFGKMDDLELLAKQAEAARV